LPNFMITEAKTKKPYDLEERTFQFARSTLNFVESLPKTIINTEIIKQVVRSSGSIGANYIEANESLSKKDYFFRVKVCRKEAKETIYWLKLLEHKNETVLIKRHSLVTEATELMKIFGSIIEKGK
jgi:four helix bundle protein